MKNKFVSAMIATMLLASMLSFAGTTVKAYTEAEPLTVDLLAGKSIDVGDVLVWNDEDYLYVKYVTTGDWYITEVHLEVATDLSGIHQSNGNPVPGKFTYGEKGLWTQEYLFDDQIALNSWTAGTTLYIAAHAKVSRMEDPGKIILYGTSLGGSGVGDKIYEIDMVSLTATVLFDTGLSPSKINGPNGNAWDPVNNRLYYSNYDSNNNLYFYDFTNLMNNLAGTIPFGINVACAGWYSGKYYYMPQGSGKLYEVTFNPDGTVSGYTMLRDFGSSFGSFGDIVITPDGSTMYGSSNKDTHNFWKINMADLSYTGISEMPHMQLAFGGDGVLYAHDASNGSFYVIDPVAGTRTYIGAIDGLKFTDLATGPYKPPTYRTETAWGAGEPDEVFPGKNWATYFTYTVQGWSVEGDWVIRVYYGNTYDHDFTFSAVQTGGTFTGTGGYPSSGPLYIITEVVTGTISGNTITFHSQYQGSTYYWDATGTIAPDGTMSGTWTSSTGQSGNWQSIGGMAVWK